MDVGQSTANDLWNQASDGKFRMEPDAAKKCAEAYTRFADGLEDQIADAQRLQSLSGFGSFQSAQDLQKGFERKGVQLTDALVGMREAALRMAAAHLRAGGMLADADALNARAIRVAQNAGGDSR
ncbi:MAG: hypothetical protein J2P18_07960 [Nocardia sp.]|nr:hypothetical protein [Nocardia sp.]